MQGFIAFVIVCVLLVGFGGCMDRGCAVNSAGATKEKQNEGTFGSHLPHHGDDGGDRLSSVVARRP